jgi:RHS repeat-associated protein
MITSVTDAENHTTTYSYTSLFGLTQLTYPDSTYEEYEYDDIGRPTSFTDGKGNEITYTYDGLSRLTQIEYPDQSTVSYTYDLNSNRTRMEDDAPNTGDYVEYSYDHWNRPATETRHISTSTYEVSYQYDAANRLTTLTYPDDMDILYSYDDLNRTTEIKRYVDGSNDEILMDNTQYNTDNLLTQFDYGNGLQATFSYDSNDRLSTIDVTNGTTAYLDLDYTLDDCNNIAQLINGWRDTSDTWHSETETYNYDGLDRLTSASCTSWSHTYSYDKTGNRTSKDSVTYTINSVNEVTALSDGTSLTYDANGNRTQKTKGTDTWDYTYDYANRLTKVKKNSATVGEYAYDGDGNRLQKTENSTTTTYICSGLSILYEKNSNGTATYIYGPFGLLAKRTVINEQTNTYFYHANHLGSTRLVTDKNKNIVLAVNYHPFGEVDIQEGSEGHLFLGKEIDSAEFYYFGARYYDPVIGGFITRDSWTYLPNDIRSFGDSVAHWLDDSRVFNRYSYCGNNPIKFTDPTGHGWLSAILSGLVLLASVALCVVLPVAAPAWVIIASYALATIAFYEHIWCVYKAITCKVDIAYGVGDHVTRVDWFDLDNNRLGGWYEIYDEETKEMVGYKVWSTEDQEWKIIPADQWTPPPPPVKGEPTKPVTYEDIIDELRNSSNSSESSSVPPIVLGGRGFSAI